MGMEKITQVEEELNKRVMGKTEEHLHYDVGIGKGLIQGTRRSIQR